MVSSAKKGSEHKLKSTHPHFPLNPAAQNKRLFFCSCEVKTQVRERYRITLLTASLEPQTELSDNELYKYIHHGKLTLRRRLPSEPAAEQKTKKGHLCFQLNKFAGCKQTAD